MKLLKVYQAFFSPTGNTEKVVKGIGKAFADYAMADIELTSKEEREKEHKFRESDLLIIGAPIYGGRLPAAVTQALEKFSGVNTPTIVVASYGNNAVGDAVLELKKCLCDKGFTVVGAGYFSAQHTYLKELGRHRPDTEDMKEIEAFGKEAREALRTMVHYDVQPLNIPGEYPYAKPPMGPLPFTVDTTQACFYCNLCVAKCPVQAISEYNPKEIDHDKCIRCGACMIVCPAQAKYFKGDGYGAIQQKLSANVGKRLPNWYQVGKR